MFRSLIPALIFVFLSKNAISFQFQMCEGVDCGEKYNESDFNSDFVNDLFNNNITMFTNYHILCIKEDENEDIVLNLDGFDPRMYIEIQNSYNYPTTNLTLQTSYTEYSEKNLLPRLNIHSFDVIIENLNNRNDETLVLYPYFVSNYESIRPKNAEKHLHFFGGEFTLYPKKIIDSTIYISNHRSTFFFDKYDIGENSMTIIFKYIPIPFKNDIRYERYEYNQGITASIYCYMGGLFTFGDHKMRYEVLDTNVSYTFIADFDNFGLFILQNENRDITAKVEDGVSGGVFATGISASSNNGNITIQGKWPYSKYLNLNSYTYNGNYYTYFSNQPNMQGLLILETNEFYVSNRNYNSLELLLTEEITNLYVIAERYDNLQFSISTDESLKNPKLFLKGSPLHRAYITSHSPDLTIYAKADMPITATNATLIYTGIDNTDNDFSESESQNNLKKGGIVQMPFTLHFNDEIDQINNIIKEYEKENPLEKGDNSIKSYAYHYINLAKDKISEISEIFNQISNKFIPINVSVINDDNTNEKSILVMKRKDYPVSFLYKNNIGKEQDVICDFENGININDWTFKHPIQINPLDPLLYPSATESGFTGEFVSTKGGKCIGYKQKTVPNSVAEIIIYTKNETFTNIFNKLDVFVVLGPNDLDISDKMNNPNAKNIVILVLDDLPDGKQINLNNVDPSANIFMVGFDSSTLEEAYDLALDFSGASEEEIFSNVTKILKERAKYQVKAGLTLNKVQTLFLGLIQYTGTNIQCTNFIPILSTFDSLVTLNADKTITESVTYGSLNSVQFNDLILAPVSIDPLTPLSVTKVTFSENSWNLDLEEYMKNDDQVNSQRLSISMPKVKGQLYLYSLTSKCVYTPDSSITKVKGISLNANFLSFFGMDDIPISITLEDHPEQSTFKSIMKKFAQSFFNMKERSSSAEFLDSEKSVTISFEGDWSKVSTIDGEFEIKTGNTNMFINGLPSSIANKIKVGNEQNININTESNEITIPDLRVLVNEKLVSFNNEKLKVNFGNIVFINERSGVSLKLGNKDNCPINAQNVEISDSSKAFISGQLTVNNLLEYGPNSDLKCDSITFGGDAILKLDYRLGSDFPPIPDGKPKQIILNYEGESNNIDDYHDYSEYLNVAKTVKVFDSSSKCQEWLGLVEFDSENYPSFRKGSEYISASCQDKSLVIKLISIPSNDDVVPDPTKSSDVTNPTTAPQTLPPIPNPTTAPQTLPPIPNPTTAPVTSQPGVTQDPIEDNTAKGEEEKEPVEITTDNNKENIENIKNQFTNNAGDDKNDQFVKIEVDENVEEVDLSGIDLDKGQYLQLPEDKPIKLDNGNLNILLNENAKKATVDIVNNENTALSIKNKEASEVVIKTKSKKVSINSNSEVYAALTLTVPPQVESVTVDSVNLHSTGTISAKTDEGKTVPLTVGNLVAQAQTKCTLSAVQISENLDIVQSASLALENVKFGENAKLNVNLRTYTQSNFDEPILHGTFSDSPSQILMKKPEQSKEDSIVKNHDYLLFRGDFVSGCDKWKDAVAFEDGTLFNDKSCNEINAAKILLESRSLVVRYNKKSKLSAGQIAGIVVGCVAGVGIIVAVVVIVVIKKKKRQNSENESDELGNV